jgi:3-deoxy-D-manno-octulosonic-acid transferase
VVLSDENFLPAMVLEGLIAGGSTERLSWRLYDLLTEQAVLSCAEQADMLARVRNVLLNERTQAAFEARRARATAEAKAKTPPAPKRGRRG